MTLEELATRIDAHLKRFEHDPETCLHFFRAGAWRAGRYVCVRYVSYQVKHHLNAAQATRYLEWLDADNVGKHSKALRG